MRNLEIQRRACARLLPLAIVGGAAVPAAAGTTSWVVPVGGSWTDPANWTAGAPTNTADAVFNAGAAAAYTVTNANGSGNSLQVLDDNVTLQLGAGLNLGTPYGQLPLSGYVGVGADAGRTASLTLDSSPGAAPGTFYFSAAAVFGRTAGATAVTFDDVVVQNGSFAATGLTFGAGSTTNIQDGATVTCSLGSALTFNAAATVDASTITQSNTPGLSVFGTAGTAASLLVRDGSTLTLGNAVGVGMNGSAGTMTVDHSTLSAGGGTFGVGVGLGRNLTTLAVYAATAGTGTVTLRNGSTGSLGTAYVGGSSPTQTGSGTLAVTDPGTAFTASLLSVAGLGGTGLVTVANGATLTAGGATVGGGGQGTLAVTGAGSKFTVGGQSLAGSLTLGAATTGSTGGMTVDNAAKAAVYGPVTVLPGGSLELGSGSSMAVAGAYNESAGASLAFTLSSPAGDLLSATGLATLGGSLDVSLGSGFLPYTGEAFQLLSFGSETGRFASVTLPTLPPGQSWDATGLYTTGTITAVPEPATAGLLVAVAGVLAGRPSRRRGSRRHDVRV